MSKEKFEKLIEYVINDDDQKARDLFHEIVVEKSREIYENLMADDVLEDDAEDFVADIEADEEGFDSVDDAAGDEFGSVEDDEFGSDDGEFGGDEADAEDLEDRVVDLEDKLDELMAEFDAIMSDEGDEEGFDVDSDEEFGSDEFGDEDNLGESVSLSPVQKPSNQEGADNTKSPVTHNSGAKGVGGTNRGPVKTDTSAESGRPAPKAKDVGVNDPQAAGKGAFKTKAPAPTTSEPSGTGKNSVNKK